MEQVESFNCFLPTLLKPKNQIDPLVKILRNILRLQSCSIHFEVNVWISVSP
jgi:hypothetical protein